MISLITMSQGNVGVLKETLQSFSGICDEIIYGDLLIFGEDTDVIDGYKKEFNLNSIPLPFNYIFQMGFSSVLNYLASNAKNDYVLYMNTSEVIDEDYGILETVKSNQDCNTFFFTHRTDPHRWFRLYNKKELEWSGLIHEEVRPIKGEIRPYHKPVFMMKDLEKDMGDPFRAEVFNLVKQLTYFEQYRKIIDYPKLLQGTNEGWRKWAIEQSPAMQERLNEMGGFYEAFKSGSFDNFYNLIHSENYLSDIKLESSKLLNLQGKRKDIL